MKRLTTAEVCALARFSRATLWRRIRAGEMPAPVDHGRQALFLAVDVERVLGAIKGPEPKPPPTKPAPRRWTADRWKNEVCEHTRTYAYEMFLRRQKP